MENYLDKCLDSLIIPNIDDIEVLVINDGSKDRSSKIAHSYAERYPNSIIAIDKENGNYGSCINRGLLEITGKYVKVLDADDSFDTNSFYEFLLRLKDVDVDMIVSDYVIVNENSDITSTHSFELPKNSICEFSKMYDAINVRDFEMHAVTYRSEIFKTINYKQTEGISYTDQEWMFMPMVAVKTVAYIPQTVYRYLVGRDGQTVNAKVSNKAVDQTMTVIKSMLKFYSNKQNVICTEKREYLRNRLWKKIPSLYRIILLKSNNKALVSSLIQFDYLLSDYSSDLYSQLNDEIILYIPYHYIKKWRLNKYNKPILLTIFNCLISIFF
jgi:glycosyltransferase involved in cell wall biosynthesis